MTSVYRSVSSAMAKRPVHYSVIFFLGFASGFVTSYWVQLSPFNNAIAFGISSAMTALIFGVIGIEFGRKIPKRKK